MILNTHMLEDIRELWGFRSFRARIFLAIFPTTIALVVGHFATDRQHPYDFFVEESYVEPPTGSRGQEMTINWKVKEHRVCPGIVERQLVDPKTDVLIAVYDPAPTDTRGAEDGWLRKTFRVPKDIQAGTLAYQAKLTYHCNWLQKLMPAIAIRYTIPRLTFYVEK